MSETRDKTTGFDWHNETPENRAAWLAEHVMGWRKTEHPHYAELGRDEADNIFCVYQGKCLKGTWYTQNEWRYRTYGEWRPLGDIAHAYEMEEGLQAQGEWLAELYARRLVDLVSYPTHYVYWMVAHATPEQRCEAAYFALTHAR